MTGTIINIQAIKDAHKARTQAEPDATSTIRDPNKKIVMTVFPSAAVYRTSSRWNVGVFFDGARVPLAVQAPTQAEMWDAAVRALRVAGIVEKASKPILLNP